VNPVSQTGIAKQGETPRNNMVFKIYRYPKDYSAFEGKTLKSLGFIEDGGPLSVSDFNPNNDVSIVIDHFNQVARVSITNAGPYAFSAYDLLGRHLGVIYSGECAQGDHTFDIPRGTMIVVRQ
jgi:hypothetical protein